ncbi:MAG: PQQ-dependent sugar dehydrogenase [Rhizobacter sp.]
MPHPATPDPCAAAPADIRRRQLIEAAWKVTALATTGSGILVGMSACGGGGGGGSANAAPAPAAPRAVVLNASLSAPWGMAFLPDGRMLVTQKSGSMVIVSANGGTVSAPLSGVPAVASAGQGGLLDVAIDPDFTIDPWVYWTYAETGSGGSGTAVARGRLSGLALTDVQVIFRQLPKVAGDGHFGSRLVFRGDKTLFVTLGERQKGSPAQDPTTHLGKVVRIARDGSVPAGNPDLGASARPELWSLGHRNPQGAALHPTTGDLWLVEHGPQGGDELNRVTAGANYGWPVKSYGCNYGDPIGEACRIGGGTHAPTYVEPVSFWVPTSIAPSGLAFYTGAGFPEWQGNAILGALAGTALWRVVLDGSTEVLRERLFGNLDERMRCVRQGPDGWLYLLTDNGKLIRIER